MKTKEEIEQLAENLYFHVDGFEEEISEGKRHYILGYTQCQEDMKQEQLSDKVLFEQAILAMEEHYGSGCETEIDAYFRGLNLSQKFIILWMQEQLNKQD